MENKQEIKNKVLSKLLNKRIILFGAAKVAEEFYEKYKDKLNISHCVSNIASEWGENRLCNELDVIQYKKEEIEENDYIVICGPFAFRSIELQLKDEGLKMFDDFIDSGIADVIFIRKPIVLFYGTCIMRDIYACICQSKKFSEMYSHMYIQIVKHQPIIVNRVLYYIKELCDIYIYMPKILDRDSIYTISRDDLPEDCNMISVSNLTVPIYWPQIDMNIDEYNDYYLHSYNVLRDLDFYHTLYRRKDKNIMRMLQENKTTEDIISAVSDENFYSEKEILKNLKVTFTMIKLAERNVDVRILDYIQDNYKEQMIYQNFVHPNKCVIWEYIRRLYIRIGVDTCELDELEKKSPLHIHQSGDVPIYPSVIKHLNLEWASDKQYEIMMGDGIEMMSFEEYMRHFIEYEKMVLDIMRMW